MLRCCLDVHFGQGRQQPKRVWTLLTAHRLWIIQECVINQRLILVCGVLSAAWDSIQTIVSQGRPDGFLTVQNWNYVGRLSAIAPITPVDSYTMMRSLRHSGPFIPEATILELASRYGMSRCSDPRDTVYGFRALAKNGHEMPVDYSCGAFDLLIQTVSLHNREKFRQWNLANDLVEEDTSFDSLHRTETFQQRNVVHEVAGGNQNFPYTNDTNERMNTVKWLQEGILKKTTIVARSMLLEPDGITAHLYDLDSDRLIIPLRSVSTPPWRKTEPDTVRHFHHYEFAERNDIPEGQVEDSVSLKVWIDDSGRINEFKLNDQWFSRSEGHVWVCNVGRAVHVSRFLYALCMAFYTDFVEYPSAPAPLLTLEAIEAYRYKPLQGDQPRRCNCDRSIRLPFPAPWIVPDGGIANDEEYHSRPPTALLETTSNATNTSMNDRGQQEQANPASKRRRES